MLPSLRWRFKHTQPLSTLFRNIKSKINVFVILHNPKMDGIMTIKEHIESFLFHCEIERQLSKNTVDAYRVDLRGLTEYSATKTIDEMLDRQHLKNYLAYMLREKGLSASTVRRRIACFKTFAKHAGQTASLEDPFDGWKPNVKRPKTLPRALSQSEFAKLVMPQYKMNEVELETQFALLLLGATGLRISEMCSILLVNIADDGSSIRVLGKGSKERIAYIGNSKVRNELSARKTKRMVCSTTKEYLFLNSHGGKLQPQIFRRRLHKFSKSQGVDKVITPHMIRHTAATLLIEMGTDIRFVQRLLGHSSIATTEIYTRVTDGALKRALFEADTMGFLTSPENLAAH